MFEMNILRLLLVAVFLSTPRYLDASIEAITRSSTLAYAAEGTVNLVLRCVLRDGETVVFAGDTFEKLLKDSHVSESTTISSIGDSRSRADLEYSVAMTSTSLYESEAYYRYHRAAYGFLIAATSQPVLRRTLARLKSSVWWNSYGRFVIVEGSPGNGGCENAYSFLWTAWKQGLLSSVYLCHDVDGRLAIYSYNPYRDYAPKTWQKVGDYKGRRGHPWTMFKQIYTDHPAVCEDIMFDKTERLNGYPIRVNALQILPMLSIKSNVTGVEKYSGEDGMTTRSLWHALNATIVETLEYNYEKFGFSTYTGMEGDIHYGNIDFGLNSRYLVAFRKLGQTYPHSSSGYCFVTNDRGNVPPWSRFSSSATFGLFGILSIAIIVLGRSGDRGYVWSFLNVLRMLLSVSLVPPPRKDTVRIFLYPIFILILVMSAVFQGRLVSVLTQPVPNSNIDTLQDLKNSGYTVVGPARFQVIFQNDSLLSASHRDIGVPNCLESMVTNQQLACISDCRHLLSIPFVQNGKYHLSKEKLTERHFVYASTKDWPLLGRVNVLIQRMVSAGLQNRWRKIFLQDMERDRWAEMRAASQPNFKVLTTDNLAHTFHLLIYGLACSTVVFVVEITGNIVKVIIPRIKQKDPRRSHIRRTR